MKLNPITLVDGYKLDHRRQYPPHTKRVYSNWTARSHKVTFPIDGVVFFGLQGALIEFCEQLNREFFDVPKERVVAQYQRRIDGYLGPNSIGTSHIAALHDLGYLPLRFSALPEGTLVPFRVPMFVVENTHPDFFWLTNYVETVLSSLIWQSTTSATIAFKFRKQLDRYQKMTGSPAAFTQWQGHDFSFRGMAGPEAAARSGAGHLLSFTGTDTVPALDYLENYYGGRYDELLGGSVAATEHAVMCAGSKDGELETFRRLLKLYPQGIVSVVSDTWDLWKVITDTLPKLKDEIMSRPGKLVIRPDSGDPVKIICGDHQAPEGTPQNRGVVGLLWDIFGGEVTKEGYKLLDPHIGVIYGDSITFERCACICADLAAHGFSTGNVVFGIGSYTYQFTTRDTFGHAMKATWAETEGEKRDLFKRPVTDDGTKFSATGRLAVRRCPGSGDLQVIERATEEQERDSLLQPVFENGKFIKYQTIAEIRKTLGAL